MATRREREVDAGQSGHDPYANRHSLASLSKLGTEIGSRRRLLKLSQAELARRAHTSAAQPWTPWRTNARRDRLLSTIHGQNAAELGEANIRITRSVERVNSANRNSAEPNCKNRRFSSDVCAYFLRRLHTPFATRIPHSDANQSTCA
jgi:hypothetical protein